MFINSVTLSSEFLLYFCFILRNMHNGTWVTNPVMFYFYSYLWATFYIFKVLERKVPVYGTVQSSPVFFQPVMPGQISSNCPHVSHTDLSLYQCMFLLPPVHLYSKWKILPLDKVIFNIATSVTVLLIITQN